MRVYKKGEQVLIKNLTWGDLCHPSTFVRWDLDSHIARWPDHIRDQIHVQIEKASKCEI